MKLSQLVWLGALGLMSAQAFAIDGVSLGLPGYGGTGCPAGSVSATLSPDATAVSLIFDSFVTEAGGVTGKSFDRKNCQISLPVHVPQGWTVSVFSMDYRGFLGVPSGGRAQLNTSYFMNFGGTAGSTPSVSFSKNFTGPQQRDYLHQNAIQASTLIWAPCGRSVILRTSANLSVNSNARRDQAMATVDSLDIRSGIIYHLQWQRCTR